ncbi:hypothetical protein J4226_00270 [Candidatus Pacearchaeota archaeon]|nr:hypothetical protein [Candidatus Pacearchaeota archaeon]
MEENFRETLEVIYEEMAESWDRFNYLANFLAEKVASELNVDEEAVLEALTDSCGDEELSLDDVISRIGSSDEEESCACCS